MKKAEGTFSVRMMPALAGESAFLRLVLEKEFGGALAGQSVVEMMATNGGDQKAGGYVALERFTGTLDGRAGSFIMQHSGTMSPEGTSIDVRISPGSGTGALAGIGGKLTIRIEGKAHYYTLDYSLAAGE